MAGVVAPRNSLEIEDISNMGLAALSAPSFVKNNTQSLQLPVLIIFLFDMGLYMYMFNPYFFFVTNASCFCLTIAND